MSPTRRGQTLPSAWRLRRFAAAVAALAVAVPAAAQQYVLVDAEGNDIAVAAPSPPAALSAFPWLRLGDLEATRQRPLFTPSRTAPFDEPPVVAAPEPEPEPAPVVESEPPPLRLAGVVASGPVTVAMLQDEESDEMVRLAPGQSVSDWVLVSVEPRAVTLRQGDREVRLVLAPPGAAAAGDESWSDE